MGVVSKNKINLAWYGENSGLVTGNAVSVFMTNYYLKDIDSMFIDGYARFGDDMFFNLDIYNADEIIYNVGLLNDSKIQIINRD